MATRVEDLGSFPAPQIGEDIKKALRDYVPRINRKTATYASIILFSAITLYKLAEHKIASASNQFDSSIPCSNADKKNPKNVPFWKKANVYFPMTDQGVQYMDNKKGTKAGDPGHVDDLDPNTIGVLGTYPVTDHYPICKDGLYPYYQTSLLREVQEPITKPEGKFNTKGKNYVTIFHR